MKMDKKGILAARFLATFVLALIIFVPACAVASKILNLSDQAMDDFFEFVKEIEEFSSDASLNEKKSVVLIMDKGTFITLFHENARQFVYRHDTFTSDGDPGRNVERESYYIDFPDRKCEGKFPCACLCREFEEKKSTPLGGSTVETNIQTGNSLIKCDSLICKEISEVNLANSKSFNRRPEKVYRELRRQVVVLTKTEQGVTLELQ
jgi:hypothetical protein